jgi:hypothetical protein
VQERVLWLLAILAGAILLVASLWPGAGAEQKMPVIVPATPGLTERIRVSVLNGCGVSQVAARMTRKTRGLGLDVIHEGNADSFGFLQSIVIDRGGDPEKASQVAALLGIPNWIQQISDDTYRLEQVQIIVGRDYKSLKLLE